jgi:hypothetical protein
VKSQQQQQQQQQESQLQLLPVLQVVVGRWTPWTGFCWWRIYAAQFCHDVMVFGKAASLSHQWCAAGALQRAAMNHVRCWHRLLDVAFYVIMVAAA